MQVGTKEHDKMLKRTQILEDGRLPVKEAKYWRIGEDYRKVYRRLLNEFELEGFVA